MNISYRWLSELVPGLSEAPETLAERLALLGFPLEGRHSFAESLKDIVVARVIEAGRHPDADRLSLCRVDAGSGEELQVICGAPNVRTGGTYPFIPVGGVLPDGMKIKKAKIRGQHSFGMLCSPRELGLGADHSGILELHGDYEPGVPFTSAIGLDDEQLDVEVTSNRGDLLCHVGMAREVAAGDGAVVLPPIPGAPEIDFAFSSDPERAEVDGIVVRTEAPELSRRFLGAIVRGVKVGPSPDWLQMRLRAVGLRPINNVVDATNYVLMELGHPTHAYDLARLESGEIVTRRAREGEPVRTLDGQDRTLTAEMLVIADGDKTINIAGIMGDESSGVTEETTDIFLECAHFEPASIRATKKALGLQSDAGYRYERFVDPMVQERALRRDLEIILAHAGGTLHPVVADVHPRPWEQQVVSLRLSRVERLLGVPFTEDEVRGHLEPLGFECAHGGEGVLDVTIPGWRGTDVTREVDLIEEVARKHGFDRFPEALGPFRPGTVPDHPLFILEDRLRDLLCGAGYHEAQTPAFVPESQGEVRLTNPLSQEEPVMRREVLPSLLRRVEYNLAHGNRDVRLFELATSFTSSECGVPHEEARVALVTTGSRGPAHWSGGRETVDIWDLKGVLEETLELTRGAGASLEPGDVAGFPGEPGLTFVALDAQGRVLGGGGMVSGAALDLPPWAGAVFGFELTLPAEPVVRRATHAEPLPSFPPSDRDLAMLVPGEVTARQVEEVARGAGGKHLESLGVFDLYEGESLSEGVRSLAYRFRFRSPERTLTDDEVDKAIRRITDRLSEELGVHIRGA